MGKLGSSRLTGADCFLRVALLDAFGRLNLPALYFP
jgi:hypothetical protein